MVKHKDKDKDRDDDRRDRRRSRSRSRDKDRRRRSRSRDRRRRSRSRSHSRRSRSHSRRSRSHSRRSRSHSRRSRSPSYRHRRDRSRDRRDRRSRSRDNRRESKVQSPPKDISHFESLQVGLANSNAGVTQPTVGLVMPGTQYSIGGLGSFSSRNFTDLLNSIPGGLEAKTADDGSAENSMDGTSQDGTRKRRRKSRWAGTDNDKTFIPGMPTILPPGMTPDQQEAYLVQLQIEEISRKLRTGDLGISQNPEERSPSPEPIYSSDGKRLNTREFRTRKRLEEQRHQLIIRMQCMNPEFKPPSDYKPPVVRVSDKVLIPQEEHPDINFVGLLIGPRGNTLKAMEKETGAKIIIRGKGSVKEGKVGRKDGQPLPGEDEPLHAFITAPNPEAVKKAVDKIKEVIRQGIEVPEGHNDLRRMQLRELAQLNGTLRESDIPRCSNCGSTEHKSWLCPDKPNITNNIVCSACGGAGHIAKDCRTKRPGMGGPPSADSQTKIDEEYMSLMAELGEGPPPEQMQQPVAPPPRHSSFSIFERAQAPRALMGSSRQQNDAPPPGQPPWIQQGGNSSRGAQPVQPPPIPPLMSQPGPPGVHSPPMQSGGNSAPLPPWSRAESMPPLPPGTMDWTSPSSGPAPPPPPMPYNWSFTPAPPPPPPPMSYPNPPIPGAQPPMPPAIPSLLSVPPPPPPIN